jgi:hypothetical protein
VDLPKDLREAKEMLAKAAVATNQVSNRIIAADDSIRRVEYFNLLKALIHIGKAHNLINSYTEHNPGPVEVIS